MAKVSICIPQYNRCDSLRIVLGDILSQTYKDFELIIVDDASTDETVKVISEFRDPRIKYFCNDHNLGLYSNFNRCLELAQGEYVAIYHNHDRYAPTIVERSVDLLDRFPQTVLVHTGTMTKRDYSSGVRYFVRNWQAIEDGRRFAKKMLFRWDSLIHQPTVMARRTIYEKVGTFDDHYYDSSADTALWMKMCVLGDVGYVPLPLMTITPRIAEDRYGEFSWLAIRGMTRVHQLALELLFPDDNLEKRIVKLISKSQADAYYFRFSLQWLAKGRMDFINAGKNIIEEECSCFTHRLISTTVACSKFLRPLLLLGGWLVRDFIYLNDRFESQNGLKILNSKKKLVKTGRGYYC